MPLKIAITGQFRRGKDTVADMMIEELGGADRVARLAFADALKQELAEMVYLSDHAYDDSNWNGFSKFEQTMRDERSINGTGWQWLGEYRRKHNGENYWIDHPQLSGLYARACDHEQHIIITDMRHHNEAQWCREREFYLVRVEGPCRAEGETRDASHPSEIHIPEIWVDATIHNVHGLEHLRSAVLSVLAAAAAAETK